MKGLLFLLLVVSSLNGFSASILIPMDETQKNHLKAYGMAFHVLQQNQDVQWLLNYRGGSFMFTSIPKLQEECTMRGITYQIIDDFQASSIIEGMANPEINQDVIKLLKVPKVAVYSPKNKLPWDDAVTMVLTYAEIPYDVVYDEDVMQGTLSNYDWVHLHHEDFTGQYGRFYAAYRNTDWYLNNQHLEETLAKKLGFPKVSLLKRAVAQQIRDFVSNGGFLFAMCSATDSYDIALATEGIDICADIFDGDAFDPAMNSKLDYGKCFAFQDFKLETNPLKYEFSEIDNQPPVRKNNHPREDFFTLLNFSAKKESVPAMLCQNHEQVIRGFMGMTTAFKKRFIKPDVIVLADNEAESEARYIHGEFGKGTWTFYSGHDPEDYQHQVGDAPTDLSLYPNSPGYRLILNNILFPATIDKHVQDDISVFPNPSSGIFYLQNETSLMNEIVVYDFMGNELLRNNLNQLSGEINLSQYSAGIYFVKIFNSNKSIVKTLIRH